MICGVVVHRRRFVHAVPHLLPTLLPANLPATHRPSPAAPVPSLVRGSCLAKNSSGAKSPRTRLRRTRPQSTPGAARGHQLGTPPKIQPSEDLSRARPPRQPERRQKHARTRPEPSRRSQVNPAGPAAAVRARGVAVWTGLGSRRAWGCRGRAVRVEAGAEERKRQGGRERKLGVGRLRETVGVSVWWGC